MPDGSSSTSMVTFWAAAAATASGLGSISTAWINRNNRIDFVRPNLIFSGCYLNEMNTLFVGCIHNDRLGPAFDVGIRVRPLGFRSDMDNLFRGITRVILNGQEIKLNQKIISESNFLYGYWNKPYVKNPPFHTYWPEPTTLEGFTNGGIVQAELSISYKDMRNYNYVQTGVLMFTLPDATVEIAGAEAIGTKIYLGLQRRRRRLPCIVSLEHYTNIEFSSLRPRLPALEKIYYFILRNSILLARKTILLLFRGEDRFGPLQ